MYMQEHHATQLWPLIMVTQGIGEFANLVNEMF